MSRRSIINVREFSNRLFPQLWKCVQTVLHQSQFEEKLLDYTNFLFIWYDGKISLPQEQWKIKLEWLRPCHLEPIQKVQVIRQSICTSIYFPSTFLITAGKSTKIKLSNSRCSEKNTTFAIADVEQLTPIPSLFDMMEKYPFHRSNGKSSQNAMISSFESYPKGSSDKAEHIRINLFHLHLLNHSLEEAPKLIWLIRGAVKRILHLPSWTLSNWLKFPLYLT